MAANIPSTPNIKSLKGWLVGAVLVVAVTGIVNSFLPVTNPIRKFMNGVK